MLISGFCGMKRLGVFLLPPGWDASPSQGYPSALNLPVPIYTPGWRHAQWELSVLPKNTTQCPQPGLEPGTLDSGTRALTMRPPLLSCIITMVKMLWTCEAELSEFTTFWAPRLYRPYTDTRGVQQHIHKVVTSNWKKVWQTLGAFC